MENVVLEIQNVVKAYSSKIAVNDISLNILGGNIFGLLGPNGAGKTTLIRMITRITVPDSGSIRFQGEILQDKHQQFIGYLPEERGLYPNMKVAEHVEYLLQLKGINRKESVRLADYWLERLELGKWKNSKVRELSKGMQQKVQLIATIAHEPPVLILDEPFSGLDPVNAQMLEDVIVEMKNKGTSIIFSTHRMEHLEELCESIALINNGQLALSGSVRALRRQYKTNQYIFEISNQVENIELPEGVSIISNKKDIDGTTFIIQLEPNINFRDSLAFFNHKYDITKVEEKIPSLRELFFKAVKTEIPSGF